jgi:hypothetical protein
LLSLQQKMLHRVGRQRLGFTHARVIWNPSSTAVFNLPANWNGYRQRDLSNNIVSLTVSSTLNTPAGALGFVREIG